MTAGRRSAVSRSGAARRAVRGGLALCCLVGAIALGACEKGAAPASGPGSSAGEKVPAGALELVFTYGSEKEKWIREATDAFNASAPKLANGRRIFVRQIPMGSGECIDEILTGRRQSHLTSPASAAFIVLGNAESRARTGRDLVGSIDNLVLSPVVIAMWKPLAEALGWGTRPVG